MVRTIFTGYAGANRRTLDFVDQLVWGVRVPGGKEKHAGGVQDGFLRVLNLLQKAPAREGWRKDGRQPC